MINIIPLSIIASFAIFFSHIFKKRIEETTIFSVLLIILILYIFGISSILNIGWYFICILSIVFFFFLLINYKKINTKLLFTWGLIFIVTTTIISLIIHRYRVVTVFDEFNHWFLAAKNMYTNNELYTSLNSNLFSKDYPPVSTIFHYFWLKPSVNFNDSLVFISMNFLIFSLLAPALSIFKNNQWKQALLSGFFLFLLPLTPCNFVYTNTFVDALLGLMFAYILLMYFTKKLDMFNFLSIIIGLSMLTLTKVTGIIFSMASAIIITTDILFFHKSITKSYHK